MPSVDLAAKPHPFAMEFLVDLAVCCGAIKGDLVLVPGTLSVEDQVAMLWFQVLEGFLLDRKSVV